jgi:NADH-quinone oxidoreductase subunit G
VDGEPYLQATARAAEVRLGPSTAEAAGITSGAMISNDRGSITLPAVIDPEMVDGVVWLPSRAPGQGVPQHLAATAGDLVTIGPGEEFEMRAELVEARPSTGSGRTDDDTGASQ